MKKAILLFICMFLTSVSYAYQWQQGAKLYGQDGKYLGNLNQNKYDPNSVNNKYGRYGSKYSPDSINNKYGKYGNKYSSQYVPNPYYNYND